MKKNKHNWYIIDVQNKILGRIATKVAYLLQGKHKVEYVPYMDCGDYIIILNIDKICVTGNKINKKIYYHHTGYIGGIKKTIFKDMINSKPKKIFEFAVKGMLPKGSLGRLMFKKLKIYAGNEHNHIAQNPKFLKI